MTVLFPRSRTRSRTAVVMHGAIDTMAPPDEQDVLVEVASISDCLTTLGYQPVTLPLTLDLDGARTVIERLKPAFVFNLVEAIGGQYSPAARVSGASFAETKPAAGNDSDTGRAANRRIEIVVAPDLSSLPGFDELQRIGASE